VEDGTLEKIGERKPETCLKQPHHAAHVPAMLPETLVCSATTQQEA
jgi:hypothetical protein